MPPLALDGDEARLLQLGEVAADRRQAETRLLGKLGDGERRPGHQCRQHVGAGRIADQGGDARDVRAFLHSLVFTELWRHVNVQSWRKDAAIQGEAGERDATAMRRALGYPGWRVVAVCFAMAVVCWGFGFYGHAFYLAELQRLHGWPTSLISSATTAYYFVSAVLVVFISDAIRRLGARACVLIGSLAFAVSVAALPFIVTPVHLFAVYLLMAVGWATMSVGAITNILGQWFDAKRGLAISLALNGASFSGVVVVPALVFLAGAAGFATAMLTGAAASCF